MSGEEQVDLREALKRVAVSLKQSGIPFALIGGYAVWARGGPEPDHDVDFMVADEDAAAAAEWLADRGVPGRPAARGLAVQGVHRRHHGRRHPPRRRVPRPGSVVEDADEIEVLSVQMPVLSATELLVHKLMAMDEHACDFGRQLPVARALREQVDWDRVRKETQGNDYAAAFLFLLERLSIVPRAVAVSRCDSPAARPPSVVASSARASPSASRPVPTASPSGRSAVAAGLDVWQACALSFARCSPARRSSRSSASSPPAASPVAGRRDRAAARHSATGSTGCGWHRCSPGRGGGAPLPRTWSSTSRRRCR